MAQYRSARGKTLDMGALMAKNERAQAVTPGGYQKLNARGDTIDSNGNVIVPVNKKVSDSYQKTIGNRSANIIKKAERLRPDDQSANNIPLAEELVPEIEDEIDADFVKEALEQEQFLVKPASEAPDFFKPEPKNKK
jgi:hypothetical protein